MTNQDARVAEAVGYYADGKICPEISGYTFRGEDNEFKVCRDCRHIYAKNEKGKHKKKPRPFISAPTAATDQIVLEWVQGQEWGVLINKFVNALYTIIEDPDDIVPITQRALHKMVEKYKPGMYARAVLAIQEERGE